MSNSTVNKQCSQLLSALRECSPLKNVHKMKITERVLFQLFAISLCEKLQSFRTKKIKF